MAWMMPAKAELLNYPLDTIDGKVYYRYTVERSVGLYRISVNFGVTQEDILKANPHLQHQGLRFEEVILIPVGDEVMRREGDEVMRKEDDEVMRKEGDEVMREEGDEVMRKEGDEVMREEGEEVMRKKKKRDTKERKRKRMVMFDDNTPVKRKSIEVPQEEKIVAVTDTIVVVDTVATVMQPIIDSTAIRLALLLPLHADAMKREKNMERFYDFYAGALIAIYEAQAAGQMLEVFTYDIGKTSNRTKEIVQQHPELHEMDAIIGPAYSQQVALVVDSLREDSIPIVIPFLSRVEAIANNLNLLKFNPSEQIEADTVARYLAAKGGEVNCVVVKAKEGEVVPSSIKALHEALQREGVPMSHVSLRALLIDSLNGEFKSDKENILIFNTERYANLQTVMPHLVKISERYRITLYSHYSWQEEEIALPQLYVSVFVQEPQVSERYQELYDTYFAHELSSVHPRYDLLGYDLTSQLLHMLRAEGDAEGKSSEGVWEGAQSRIQYRQTTPEGGYENYIIHIIHQ